MRNRCWRNEDDDEHNNHVPTLSVFEPQGTAIEKERSRYLTDRKYIATHLYMLLNCDEVKPYVGWMLPFNNRSCIEYILKNNSAFIMCTKCHRIFTEQVRTAHPNVSDVDIDTIIETHFAD